MKAHDDIKARAVKALVFEIVGYGAVGFGGLYIVSDGISSIEGFIGGIGILVIAFVCLGLFKYLPNVAAHNYLHEWLGSEYKKALEEELQKSSYSSLFRNNWFIKHQDFCNKVYPSPIKKKLMQQQDQKTGEDSRLD